MAYLTGAAQLLATLDSQIEAEVYAGKLAEEMGVDKSAILLQMKKQSRQRVHQERKRQFREVQQEMSAVRDKINPEKSRHLRSVNAEEALIAYLFAHPDAVSWITKRISPEKFSTSFTQRVYRAVLGKITNNQPLSLTDLTEVLTAEEISAVARILARYHSVAMSQEDAQEYIQVIKQEAGRMERRRTSQCFSAGFDAAASGAAGNETIGGLSFMAVQDKKAVIKNCWNQGKSKGFFNNKRDSGCVRRNGF